MTLMNDGDDNKLNNDLVLQEARALASSDVSS